jgi:hypothetical protein
MILIRVFVPGKYTNPDEGHAYDNRTSRPDLLVPGALERVVQLQSIADYLNCDIAQLSIAWAATHPQVRCQHPSHIRLITALTRTDIHCNAQPNDAGQDNRACEGPGSSSLSYGDYLFEDQRDIFL